MRITKQAIFLAVLLMLAAAARFAGSEREVDQSRATVPSAVAVQNSALLWRM